MQSNAKSLQVAPNDSKGHIQNDDTVNTLNTLFKLLKPNIWMQDSGTVAGISCYPTVWSEAVVAILNLAVFSLFEVFFCIRLCYKSLQIFF